MLLLRITRLAARHTATARNGVNHGNEIRLPAFRNYFAIQKFPNVPSPDHLNLIPHLALTRIALCNRMGLSKLDLAQH